MASGRLSEEDDELAFLEELLTAPAAPPQAQSSLAKPQIPDEEERWTTKGLADNLLGLSSAGPARSSSPPRSLVCPITGEVMVEPVMVVHSGMTYSRAAITEWFALGRRTDPETNLDLPSTQVVPNVAVQRMIDDYHASNQQSVHVPNPLLSTSAKDHVPPSSSGSAKKYGATLSGTLPPVAQPPGQAEDPIPPPAPLAAPTPALSSLSEPPSLDDRPVPQRGAPQWMEHLGAPAALPQVAPPPPPATAPAPTPRWARESDPKASSAEPSAPPPSRGAPAAVPAPDLSSSREFPSFGPEQASRAPGARPRWNVVLDAPLPASPGPSPAVPGAAGPAPPEPPRGLGGPQDPAPARPAPPPRPALDAAGKLFDQSRYKTKLCEAFQAGGQCRYGDRCQFAHGREELRSPPGPSWGGAGAGLARGVEDRAVSAARGVREGGGAAARGGGGGGAACSGGAGLSDGEEDPGERRKEAERKEAEKEERARQRAEERELKRAEKERQRADKEAEAERRRAAKEAERKKEAERRRRAEEARAEERRAEEARRAAARSQREAAAKAEAAQRAAEAKAKKEAEQEAREREAKQREKLEEAANKKREYLAKKAAEAEERRVKREAAQAAAQAEADRKAKERAEQERAEQMARREQDWIQLLEQCWTLCINLGRGMCRLVLWIPTFAITTALDTLKWVVRTAFQVLSTIWFLRRAIVNIYMVYFAWRGVVWAWRWLWGSGETDCSPAPPLSEEGSWVWASSDGFGFANDDDDDDADYEVEDVAWERVNQRWDVAWERAARAEWAAAEGARAAAELPSCFTAAQAEEEAGTVGWVLEVILGPWKAVGLTRIPGAIRWMMACAWYWQIIFYGLFHFVLYPLAYSFGQSVSDCRMPEGWSRSYSDRLEEDVFWYDPCRDTYTREDVLDSSGSRVAVDRSRNTFQFTVGKRPGLREGECGCARCWMNRGVEELRSEEAALQLYRRSVRPTRFGVGDAVKVWHPRGGKGPGAQRTAAAGWVFGRVVTEWWSPEMSANREISERGSGHDWFPYLVQLDGVFRKVKQKPVPVNVIVREDSRAAIRDHDDDDDDGLEEGDPRSDVLVPCVSVEEYEATSRTITAFVCDLVLPIR